MDKLKLIDQKCYVFDEHKGIYSKYKKKWCECSLSDDGYTYVKLKCVDGKRRHFQFHRVMCYIFKPIPLKYQGIPLENLEIDHIKPLKNGGTNELSNLRWSTRKDNANNEETKRNMSKALTNRKDQSKIVDQIDKITGEVVHQWESTKDIERELGIDQANICHCCNGGYYSKSRGKWINVKQTHGYIWKYPILE